MSDPRPEIACRSCSSTSLEVFLDLGEHPPSDALRSPEQLDQPEPRYPLEVAFCKECALVQILETVPPEELFGDDYPYFSSFIDSLVEHSRQHVEARLEERPQPARVIELASNDGYLLQFYAERGISVLGIDPAKGPVEAARKKGIETRHAFFTEQLAEELAGAGIQAEILHANNVLAHVADTRGFVRGIAKILMDEGVAVFEVPHLRPLIEHREFDTIYHEHLCYFSGLALDRLFRESGLFVNHVEHLPIHGGSLRIFVEKREDPRESMLSLLAEERALGMDRIEFFQDFAAQVASLRDELRALLEGLRKDGKKIAAYGAAAKGATLLNYCEIDEQWLDFAVDRNVHKQGKYMPGTRLEIRAPEALLDAQPDYCLILPWNFRDEIVAQQREYTQRGGRFIVPVPRPQVLEQAPDRAAERPRES
jgi:SAM-dependent methyltransferase